MRTIYVIEGPAGAGKTTLISRLRETHQMELIGPIVEIDRPRAYTGLQGMALSQAKDVCSLLSLFISICTRPAIIDRFSISQFVYGTIRRNGEMKYRTQEDFILDARKTIDRTLILAEALWSDHIARMGDPRHLTSPRFPYDFRFLVMLPGQELLGEHRESQIAAGRVFPYELERELNLYEHTVLATSGNNILSDTISYSVYPFRFYDHGESYEKAISEWFAPAV